MIGIFLALLTAVSYSFSQVYVRKRLEQSNYFAVVVIINIIGNLILWPLTLLLTQFDSIACDSLLFFIIAGILHPGIVAMLFFKGLEKVGASINASIFAVNPLFTSIFAVILLQEVLSFVNWMGILSIIAGIFLIERLLNNQNRYGRKILNTGLVWPLAASFISTLSYVARKYALTLYNAPLLGVSIGYSLSLLISVVLWLFSKQKRSQLVLKRDLKLFWKAGIFSAIGWLSTFYALTYERVSVVSALTQIQPLCVLLFSYLYLKNIELFSSRLLLSTFLIVIGAISVIYL